MDIISGIWKALIVGADDGQRKGEAMSTFELITWTLATCLWGYFWGFRQAKKEEKESNERRKRCQ